MTSNISKALDVIRRAELREELHRLREKYDGMIRRGYHLPEANEYQHDAFARTAANLMRARQRLADLELPKVADDSEFDE